MGRYLLTLAALLFSAGAVADLQFRMKDVTGGSTVSSNGQKARIDASGTPGFVIIDYASGEIFMIDPGRNEILHTNVSGSGEVEQDIGVRLKDKGGGQKIAGYDTRKYELMAGGRQCGTVYASEKLFEYAGVRGMYESMRNLQRATRSMMGGMSSMLTDCQRAGMQMSEVMESAGAPMKILDENGRLISEVLSVDTAKPLPADYYDLPTGMKMVDMREMAQRTMEQTREALEQMPEMNDLMQQIQQSGGQMDEDMQQQMQQMLEQLQQSQQ